MTTRRSVWLAAAALILLTIVIRLPALLHDGPIDDEAVYAVVADAMVHGGLPYVSAVERKPPLLFWTYAAVFSLSGSPNWVALHATTILWILATMLGLYVLGRHVFNRDAGLVAAALYTVFQPWGTWKNLALNGEVLMNLPIVWGWAIALSTPRAAGSAPVGIRPARSRTRPELGVAGGLLAAACLLKQPAAIAAVPLVCYLLLPSYRAVRGLTQHDVALQVGWLAGGFAAAMAVCALILRWQGILGEALYWTVGNHDVPHIFWTQALLHTLAFLAACLPLLAGAILTVRNGELWEARRAERVALLLLVAMSAVGVAASGRFYPHYYIQLVPPLSVLAAPTILRFWRGARVNPASSMRRTVIAAWPAVAAVVFGAAHWRGVATDVEVSETGRYLRQHAEPAARIFVWGQAPRIYLDAQRQPASRYIATFPLTGYVFGGPVPGLDTRSRIVPGAWTNLWKDFDDHPPTYVVDTEAGAAAGFPVAGFPDLARLLAEHYTPVIRTREGEIYRRLAK